MKNDETGEFELVLGNKQLLSGFFIVVILFAVFFVMGYIVGRNSTPATQLAAARDAPAGGGAPNARPQASSGTAAAPQNLPAPADPSLANPAGEPQPATQPAQSPPPRTEAPAPAAPAPPEQTAEGTYLQVVSVGAHDAELLARTLKDKGFPSSTSPAPNGKTTRVLVGPYADLSALGKAKVELENLGFHPIVKR